MTYGERWYTDRRRRKSAVMMWLVRVLTVGAVTLGCLVFASVAYAYPPEPPGEQQIRAELAALTVAGEGSMDGYDRDKFPHWIGQQGNCDTREVVLRRDGADVTTGDDCYPTSGSWYSVYDQQWVADPSDVHIDHIVALAEAWRSGADSWTEARRTDFANDLDHPQLIAVSADSNLSKSDSDPSEWQPPNEGVWCIYAREWVHVKYLYDLAVDQPEKAALDGMLDHC